MDVCIEELCYAMLYTIKGLQEQNDGISFVGILIHPPTFFNAYNNTHFEDGIIHKLCPNRMVIALLIAHPALR